MVFLIDSGSPGGASSNQNLIHNWYFVNPINQRGQTEYTGNGYGIDRWAMASSVASVSTADDGVTLDNTAGTGNSWFQQFIGCDVTDKIVTISLLLADGTFWSASGVASAENGVRSPLVSISASGVFSGQLYVEKVSVANVNATHKVAISTPAGISNTIVAIKLELGDTQTLAHQDDGGTWVLNDPPPDKGMELLKCCMSTADGADAYANNKATSQTGLYTGTGTYGVDNPNSLTFDFNPKMVIVYENDGSEKTEMAIPLMMIRSGWYTPVIARYSSSGAKSNCVYYEFGDKTVTWYLKCGSSNAVAQQNNSGRSYVWIAIG